jgi:hypothetical protein
MNWDHVKKAARLQLIYGRVGLVMPWTILTTSFLINLVIFSAVGNTKPGGNTTGGLTSLYIGQMIINLVTVTQIFPFAVSMSITRRAFIVATGLLMVVLSLANGVLLTALKTIEHATNGWGLRLHFFGLSYITQDNPLLQVLVYAVPMAVLGLLGICLGSVFHRWGVFGMWMTTIGILVVGGLSIAAVFFFEWSSAVADFFHGQPAFAMLAVYPLLVGALAAAGASRMMLRSRI